MWGFPGTITSVTRLASSWARTLDRLTLDCRDLERSEQLRRLRPQSLTQGMVQGLSEFGISLIGEFHLQRTFLKLKSTSIRIPLSSSSVLPSISFLFFNINSKIYHQYIYITCGTRCYAYPYEKIKLLKKLNQLYLKKAFELNLLTLRFVL